MRISICLIIFAFLIIALKWILGRIRDSLSSSETTMPRRMLTACVKFYQACREFYRNIDSGAVLRVKIYFLISWAYLICFVNQFYALHPTFVNVSLAVIVVFALYLCYIGGKK